ncbi:MAG: penicillin-binding protein activator, partial [Boseongicola sp. SB0662_bin_57]|nr:penicillin-binding protein activator [Boseongicola sp. SB0662_bin_57]
MLARLPLCRKVMTWMAALAALAACEPTTSTTGPLINPDEEVPVALLVPKTAPNGAILAQSLENAALMAVEDLGSIEVSLRVYDTSGTPDGAAEAARLAIQDGAKIILGPLFAENARAVGPVAAASGINVLTFSNNPAVAGENVFILGNTFQTTADRLVEYALSQGKSGIFVVHADDPAERVGAEAIEQAAREAGGIVLGVQSFALSQQGVVDAIPGIASSFLANGADTIFVTSGN